LNIQCNNFQRRGTLGLRRWGFAPILRRSPSAPRRWGHLSSNVRPQSHAVHAAHVLAWHRWSAEVMNSLGVSLQERFLAATRKEIASVAHFCQPSQGSDDSLSLGKLFTSFQASGPRKGLKCLVSGWRFAPPRCAGQSVGRPLRPCGAPARLRVFVLWHQTPSNHLLSSHMNSGSLLPPRRRSTVSAGHLGHSTVPASPLRPNPSVKPSPNSKTLGPRRCPVHHQRRGPSVSLLGLPYLER
jgi:hypothetical protein